MIEFAQRYPDKLITPLLEHLEIVAVTLVLSVVAAAFLTLLAMYMDWFAGLIVQIFSVIYAVPSLALFALLIPVTGLGARTAIIVLVLYNQYLLLRNFITGLLEVEPAIIEAARGLGMTTFQILIRIRLPLSKRALFAGIHLSVVSTIGIATIAASINAGGLGTLLFDGLRTVNTVKMVWGSILSAGLAICMNGILSIAERRFNEGAEK